MAIEMMKIQSYLVDRLTLAPCSTGFDTTYFRSILIVMMSATLPLPLFGFYRIEFSLRMSDWSHCESPRRYVCTDPLNAHGRTPSRLVLNGIYDMS